MSYQPVGADEENNLPPAVVEKLGETFAHLQIQAPNYPTVDLPPDPADGRIAFDSDNDYLVVGVDGDWAPVGEVDPEMVEAAVEDYMTENPPAVSSVAGLTGNVAAEALAGELDEYFGSAGDVAELEELVTEGRLSEDELSATYAEKTDTGYTGSDDLVQAPVLQPSPVDARNLVDPASTKPVKIGVRAELGTKVDNAAITLDKDLNAGERRNLWQYTEDVAANRYLGSSTMTVTSDQITVDGIVLTRVTSSNFYANLRSQVNGLGLSIFTSGRRYLLSYYALSCSDVEKFFWIREIGQTGNYAHGKRYLPPNTLRRIWGLFEAQSTGHMANFDTPASGYSSGGASHDPRWLVQGNAEGNALDMYVGGFQIEDLGTTAKSGIIGIGDSTMQGASGSNDAGASREWMGYLEAILNTYTFNRGVGGERLDQMDSRWATDITPLVGVAKYVIIQGGINDISQGRTLGQMQTSVGSMATKAATDTLTPVYLTITPNAITAANSTKETQRLAFNAWLKQTYPRVVDIAAVVADPLDAKFLRRTPGGAAGWYGDAIHFTRGAKRAIAEHIAAQPWWELPTPSPYQKIAVSTFTPAGGFVIVSPDGTKYRITVANGGALSTTAV